MLTHKSLTLSLLLVITTSVNSRPINYYNYAPAHEYKEQDYTFSYGVKDVHTGDVKSQWEKKQGDVVTGHYSFLEADGSVRTVEYTADGVNGFKAVVKHDVPFRHPMTSKSSSHQQVQMNQHQVQPTQEPHYNLQKNELEPIYQYGESSPSASTYAFQTITKHPQNEKTEPIAQENSQTFKPPPQVHYVKVPSKPAKISTNFKKTPLPQLPVDLSLLAGGEKLIPVDISVINPVEISLTEATVTKLRDQHLNAYEQFQNAQPAQPTYHFENYNKFGEPLYENGFRPISTTPRSVKIPNNTFLSGKKPSVTPGLRHYTSYINSRPNARPIKVQPYQGIHSGLMPFIFAKQLTDYNQDTLQKAEVTRLHPAPAVPKNSFVRYAKHIRFAGEDK